jgi:hypothetical protein
MMAKIAPVDSQKRWGEKFVETVKDLDATEANLNLNCMQLNTLRVNTSACLRCCLCIHTMTLTPHLIRVAASLPGHFSV